MSASTEALKQQFQQRNASLGQRVAQAQAAKSKEEKPVNDFDIFTSNVPEHPTTDLVWAAVHRADHIGTLDHPIYGHTRDSIVAFTMHWNPESALDNAIARMCVPLVGYARLLGYLTIVAKHGHVWGAKGVKPRELRFADIVPIGKHVQGYFLEALHVGRVEVSSYLNFVAHNITEDELDGEFSKHVKPVQAALLAQAAAVLKDGIRAVHGGIAAGFKSTHDLIPSQEDSQTAGEPASQTDGEPPEQPQPEQPEESNNAQ